MWPRRRSRWLTPWPDCRPYSTRSAPPTNASPSPTTDTRSGAFAVPEPESLDETLDLLSPPGAVAQPRRRTPTRRRATGTGWCTGSTPDTGRACGQDRPSRRRVPAARIRRPYARSVGASRVRPYTPPCQPGIPTEAVTTAERRHRRRGIPDDRLGTASRHATGFAEHRHAPPCPPSSPGESHPRDTRRPSCGASMISSLTGRTFSHPAGIAVSPRQPAASPSGAGRRADGSVKLTADLGC
jgi:hypothetical protein